MPQITTHAVLDAAATPVAHTYVPRGVLGGGEAVVFEEVVGGVPIGANTLTVKNPKKTAGGRYNGSIKYVLPQVVTETVNGVSNPVLNRTNYIELSYSFAGNSTEQERADALAIVCQSSQPGKPMVYDPIVKLQSLF